MLDNDSIYLCGYGMGHSKCSLAETDIKVGGGHRPNAPVSFDSIECVGKVT